MIIRKPSDLPYSQVTPKQVYVNRRRFLGAAPIALGALLGSRAAQATTKLAGVTKSSYTVDDKVTPLDVITHYNNFYEFGTDKEDPSRNAQNFRTSPWMVKVEGEVAKPKILDLDALMKLAPLEERIYRHRCVEAWSIVVPWIGYPLNALLKEVEPTSKAKFVAFESYYDRKQMPQGTWAGIQFPYVEGLRLDEAMNPLALLAVGLYGETLPNQDGAPFRLVVPWKYGFKSIKSIVKIKLVEKMPPTTWNLSAPQEYGFYSNVNPEVDHPRWSQAKERRLGEFLKRNTLKFNGYGEQVASLYTGMDLRKNY
ncbi:MAG TPA: protein-methionine-sulfoxide reductase catalytic subunit MsrP [Bryobacteraceae bacterium]|jgi:sulfoxide reductase catalytic subunit YedY|nr:protein-methionine-sulfoxide reductase catalytic subunit MsrP [Bryobacteraceae bacterium]